MNSRGLLKGLAIGLLAAQGAGAAALYKVNNTDDLNLLSSWSTTSGSQTPNPGSFTTADTWYFNEVTMLGSKTVELGGDIALGGMALDYVSANNDNNLVIAGGGTLTLNGGTLYGNGASGSGGSYTATGILLNRGLGGTITINPNVALGAAQTWVTGRSSGNPLTINGALSLSSYNLNLNMVGNAAAVNTFAGPIGGSGKITKYGAATLVVSGNNSGFSGGFQLGPDGGGANVGVVVAGHANALGTGTITSRGTQLQSGVAGLTITNTVTVGAGGLRLGGTNDFTLSGTTVLDAATRSIQNYGSATVTMGSVDLTAGTLALASFETGKFIVSGAISGAGGVRTQNATLTLDGVSTYTGTTTVNNAAARLNLNGSLTSTIIVLSGRLSGTGSTTGPLVMSGGGFALAGGASTGGLTVNGATISGAPTVIFDAAPVASTVYDIFTYGAGAVSGAGNLTTAYRGAISDDAANSKYIFTAGEQGATRTWNTGAGTWSVGPANANWAEGDNLFYTGDHAVFGDIGADTAVTLSGTIQPGSVVVGNAANTYTFQSGAVSGAAGLTKNGDGALKIATQQTYTGGTTVNGGTLDLTGGGGAGGSIRGTVTVNAGATLKLSNGDALGYNNDATAVNAIYLAGGTMTSATGANQTTTAKIYLTGGTIDGTVNLDLFSNNSRITTYASGNPSTIAVTTMNLRQNDTVFDIADGGAVQDLVVSSILGNGSAGNHNMIKDGAGTMALTTTNNFQGNVTVNAGVLDVTAGKLYSAAYDNTRVVTVNTGGTLRLTHFTYDAAGSLGKLADYAARRVLNGGAIEVVGGTHESGNDFTVAAAGGTFRYNPSNAADTLTLNGNANDNIQLNGDLTLEAGGNVLIGEILQGTGGLNKTGAGALTLSGANSYGGATTVSGGLLAINGVHSGGGSVTVADTATLGGTGSVADVTAQAGGRVAPGNSIGRLSVDDFTLESGAAMTMELGAPDTPGETYDQVLAAGALSFSGLQWTDFTFLPQDGFGAGSYTLVDAASFGVTATLGAVTNGTIGSFDSYLWKDADNSNLVLTVIPEPGTLGLLLLAGLAVHRVRRRRR